jgi:hypothetical protein
MQITKRGNQMSRVVRKTVLQSAIFAAVLATGGFARADEYALVLIDFSGSMAGLSDATQNKMTVAKTRAKNFLLAPVMGRKYAVWMFFNNSTTGTSFYQPVVSFIENKNGPDAAAALDMVLPDGSIPPGMNLTPLAGSMCAAMRDLIDSSAASTANRHLYTISDGMENSTPANPDPRFDCSGPPSSTPFNDSLPNAGLEPGSWEYKVRNMAANGFANDSSDPPTDNHMILDVDYLREWVPTAPLMMARQAVTFDHQMSTPLVAVSSSKLSANAAAPVEDPLLVFYKGITKMTGGHFADVGGIEKPVPQLMGDVDDNGCVNSRDLKIVTKAFTKHTKGDHPADINRDHKIDQVDAKIVIKNFDTGPNCPCKD